MLLMLDRIDEAESLIRKVYETRVRVSGPDGDQTISALDELAGAIYQRGDVAGAADLMKQVWDARRRTIGDDRPLTLLAGSNLATLYYRLGRAEEADKMLADLIPTFDTINMIGGEVEQ